MSNLSQFFGGAGSSPSILSVFVTSGVFVIPRDGEYRLTVVGAGGTGAHMMYSTSSRAKGGGAGGLAQKTLPLRSGDELVLMVGSGNQITANRENMEGLKGGDSSITGTGFYLLAEGGAGGKYSSSVGADGGDATGGDFNFKGGGSGGGDRGATGGGAVNILGVDPETIRSADSNGTSNCTGGASPGEFNPPVGSEKGGSMSVGYLMGRNATTETVPFAIRPFTGIPPFSLFGVADSALPGGGSSGRYTQFGGSSDPGAFAGSGASYGATTSRAAGVPSCGGGGGGGITNEKGRFESSGGDGLIIIEEL